MPSCIYTKTRSTAPKPKWCKPPPPPEPPPTPPPPPPTGTYSVTPEDYTTGPGMPVYYDCYGDKDTYPDGDPVDMLYWLNEYPLELQTPSYDAVHWYVDFEAPYDPGDYTFRVLWTYPDSTTHEDTAILHVVPE